MPDKSNQINRECSRWVSVCVDTFDHAVLDSGPYDRRSAWLWLIANAAWRDKRVNHKGKPFDLKRGQLLGARSYLAEKWGWSEQSVRTFLAVLLAESMIEINQSHGHVANVITICNYDAYQAPEKSGNQPTNQCLTSAQPVPNHTLTSNTLTTSNNNQRSITTPREAAALPTVDDLKALSNRMFAAAGKALASEAIAPGLASMMVPQMWLDQGCDLDRDVLPAVRNVAARAKQKIRSWDYFTPAVHEARDKRLAGKPMLSAKVIPMVRELTEAELEIAREESRAVIRAAQARIAKCAQLQTSPTNTDWNSEATATAASTQPARSVHPFDLPLEGAESACRF